MFCEKCGKERIEDAKFCENCGNPYEVQELLAVKKLEPAITVNGTPPVEPSSSADQEQPPRLKTQKMEEADGPKNPERREYQKFTEGPAETENRKDTVNRKETVNPKESLNQKKSEKPQELKETQDSAPFKREDAGIGDEKSDPEQQSTGDNGYQWIYEFSFWKNPAILITTAKVLILALFVPALFLFLLTLGDGMEEAFQVAGTIFGYGLLLMAALLAVAYPLVGLIHGGKYLVLFKMDDKGIDHIQLHSQVKKAEALGFLTALVGLAAGNLTASGAGLMAATRHNLYTNFKKVKSVQAVRSRNTIYLSESLTRNQIYPEKGQFDQVLEHILKHSPKSVRVKGR